ncbi:hypothetical protein N8085_02520 [Salibacteraceae bacterium]|nr:hypothetical protein [Salibacteraceae bacterium]
MNKDFKLWLIKNNQEDDYSVKEFKEDIERDFQYETFHKDPDNFIKWMVEFPDQARKYFPQIVLPLEDRLKDSNDITTIGVLRVIVDGFYTSREKIEGLLEIDKKESISQQIHLIDMALQHEKDESEIIHTYVNQNKEKLLSYREYWETQLPSLKTEDIFQDKTIESINQSFDAAHEKGWRFFFKSKNTRDVFYRLLANHFQGKRVILPSKVIEVNPKTKTKLAKLLRDVYWNNSEVTLRSNTEFHSIIRSLKPFEEEMNVPKLVGR